MTVRSHREVCLNYPCIIYVTETQPVFRHLWNESDSNMRGKCNQQQVSCKSTCHWEPSTSRTGLWILTHYWYKIVTSISSCALCAGGSYAYVYLCFYVFVGGYCAFFCKSKVHIFISTWNMSIYNICIYVQIAHWDK